MGFLLLLNYEYIEFFNLIFSDIYSLKNNKENYLNNEAKRIAVLTYHRIVNDWEKKKKEYRQSSLILSRSIFKQQMKWLKKRGYKTISCEEFYFWHQGKNILPKKSVLITFDGGTIGQAKYGMHILKKYNMKGTSFIIGNLTYNNKKGIISYIKMNKIKKLYPNFEFQSHTFDLHFHLTKNVYNKTKKDALTQKHYYDFKYLAYPYGFFSRDMIKAYRDTGIKMAFTYGKNRFATRLQDIYRIRRIKVNARESFSHFTRWFTD